MTEKTLQEWLDIITVHTPLVLTRSQIELLKRVGWQFDEEQQLCTGGRYQVLEMPRFTESHDRLE